METKNLTKIAFALAAALILAPIAFAWESGGSSWSSGGTSWSTGGTSWSSGGTSWDAGGSSGGSWSSGGSSGSTWDTGNPWTGGFTNLWITLNDKTVLEESADGTVVYSNINDKCIFGNFKIVSYPSSHYTLYFDGDDLKIRDMQENYFDNGERVKLKCGIFPAYFKLKIANTPDAPQILNLDEINAGVKESVSVNLAEHEFDPDGNSGLLWSMSSTATYNQIFDAELEGKTLTVIGKNPGGSHIRLRLEDPTGLHDEKEVLVKVGSGSSDESSEEEEEESKSGIFISSIRVNGNSIKGAGDTLESYVTIKNSGDEDLEDVRMTMVIQELAARGVVGPFDLNDGKTVTKRISLDIYDDVEVSENVYFARFTISSDKERRVVYREIDVQK